MKVEDLKVGWTYKIKALGFYYSFPYIGSHCGEYNFGNALYLSKKEVEENVI
jgi:hypothetical protein